MTVKPDWICDIGAGFGIFIEELSNLLPDIPVLAIEPTPTLAQELKAKGIRTIDKFLEDVTIADLPKGRGFFTSFELLEHLQNPLHFLQDVRRLCGEDSAFLATTLSSWGLDIQLLREKSKAIFPPHHLQILSPKAMTGLGNRAGFKDILVTTPGKLDIDISERNIQHISDGFWKIFLTEASESEKNRMQQLLASLGFSSHMWCLLKC